MAQIAAANEEAILAWDGPLYDRFVRFRDLNLNLAAGFQQFGQHVCPRHKLVRCGRMPIWTLPYDEQSFRTDRGCGSAR